MPNEPVVAAPSSVLRVRVFVDFWNFQLGLNEEVHPEYRIDWRALGPWFTTEVGKLALAAGGANSMLRYEAMHVYVSHDPRKADRRFKNWVSTILNRFPGVQAILMERKPKRPPKCPDCHKQIDECPHCKGRMWGSVEKGVDTAMVTDMVRLAWENSYDIAVLVSSDRDFIPGVEFLNSKGLKVVHAGFLPKGSDLAQRCWASFDLKRARVPEEVRAAPTAPAPKA